MINHKILIYAYCIILFLSRNVKERKKERKEGKKKKKETKKESKRKKEIWKENSP